MTLRLPLEDSTKEDITWSWRKLSVQSPAPAPALAPAPAPLSGEEGNNHRIWSRSRSRYVAPLLAVAGLVGAMLYRTLEAGAAGEEIVVTAKVRNELHEESEKGDADCEQGSPELVEAKVVREPSDVRYCLQGVLRIGLVLFLCMLAAAVAGSKVAIWHPYY